MRLNDMERVQAAMAGASEVEDGLMVKQMAMMLGEHRMFGFVSEEEDANSLVSNESLWEHFQTLARELNVEEAKSPEDVYKSHLSEPVAR